MERWGKSFRGKEMFGNVSVLFQNLSPKSQNLEPGGKGERRRKKTEVHCPGPIDRVVRVAA